MKSFEDTIKESTCQKRVTICEIYDIDGNLLSRQSNRCSPDGGVCHRLSTTNGKDDYPVNSNCNWTHAEINTINNLPGGSRPYKAVLYGHDFYCDNCETSLKKAGVVIMEVSTKSISR